MVHESRHVHKHNHNDSLFHSPLDASDLLRNCMLYNYMFISQLCHHWLLVVVSEIY